MTVAAPIVITAGDDNTRVELEYRALPGWPRHRIGSDRSVWHREDRAGFTPAPPRPRRRRQRCDTALDRRQAAECRRLHSAGWSYAALADRYGCGTVTVWKVLAPVRSPTWSTATGRPNRAGSGSSRFATGPAPPSGCTTAIGSRSGSIELLWRAAFAPASLTAATIARIAPRGPRPPATIIPPSARPAIAPPRPVAPPATVEPIVAAEVAELVPVAELPDDEGYRVGSRHGRAKLDEASVLEARRLHRSGWSYQALCERYGGIGRSDASLRPGRSNVVPRADGMRVEPASNGYIGPYSVDWSRTCSDDSETRWHVAEVRRRKPRGDATTDFEMRCRGRAALTEPPRRYDVGQIRDFLDHCAVGDARQALRSCQWGKDERRARRDAGALCPGLEHPATAP